MFELDQYKVRSLVKAGRAINHKRRQRLMSVIKDCDKQNSMTHMNVTDIYIKMRLEQSIVSQDLKKLRVTGFVESLRQGKYVYYFLTEKYKDYV